MRRCTVLRACAPIKRRSPVCLPPLLCGRQTIQTTKTAARAARRYRGVAGDCVCAGGGEYNSRNKRKRRFVVREGVENGRLVANS